jgi:hypothetical protein
MQSPRRQAGESLRELRDERVLFPTIQLMAFSFGGLTFTGAAWGELAMGNRWPWYTTSAAIVFLAATGVQFVIAVKRAKPYNRGLRGERAVADALDELAAHGYRVFHDLPDTTASGKPCNIDHVLAGPEGVFVVETKFRTRPDKASATVTPDAILLDGKPMTPDPRIQTELCARSVERRLKQNLGDSPRIQPVVLLPGWHPDGGFKGAVWVLGEKSLVTTLKRPVGQLLDDRTLKSVLAQLDTWSREPATARG